MDDLLDINDLVLRDKHTERHILDIFAGVLKQCHAAIKQYNRVGVKTMDFEVPSYIYGKPRYDSNVLRNYLVYHLKDNGISVTVLSPNRLYISWKDEDLDLDKFLNRKSRIEQRSHDKIMGAPADHMTNIQLLRFRQERQRQLRRGPMEDIRSQAAH